MPKTLVGHWKSHALNEIECRLGGEPLFDIVTSSMAN